ncbi:hypothetical protein MHTCC0001_15150 [Flavobacteriaceae bacterium MHTCC 0001]
MGFSQTIEITGRVTSKGNVENIHVINKTAQKFTITDKKGHFKIPAALNDTLSFSSVQHQTKDIIITKDIITSKGITITLNEQINELDEVKIGNMLTGNLLTDMNNAEIVKLVDLNLNKIELSSLKLDDLALEKKSTQDHFTYILNPDARFYNPDIFKIAQALFNVDLSLKAKVLNGDSKEKPKFLLDIFDRKVLNESFNIPLIRVNEFISFIESEGFDPSYLKDRNRHLLVEFLMKKSEVFVKDGLKK